MALSQNVVINFLTKFDKKGLDRATKELKGFDKFVAISSKGLKAGLFAGAAAPAFAVHALHVYFCRRLRKRKETRAEAHFQVLAEHLTGKHFKRAFQI